MKTIIRRRRTFPQRWLAIAAVLSVVALAEAYALTVPELPTPVFADTEVTTNVAMTAWIETTRQFNIILQFDATPTNNVQVAFGTDESADGNLSDEETGLTLSWDCGAWFIYKSSPVEPMP